MMWMIPLLAWMSALVTVASLTWTLPPLVTTLSVPPCTVGGEVGEVMLIAVAASIFWPAMTW